MTTDFEETAKVIVDAAIAVHRALGPGLLESAYQKCLAYDLRKRDRFVETEIVLPIVYDGQQIDAGFRMDMRVDRCVLVENKAVDAILRIHQAQLITYLKLSGLRLGFILNWNVKLMKHGIQRIIL